MLARYSRIRKEAMRKALEGIVVVAELFEQVAQILGHIVIEKELHSDERAICRATSKSIAPRWSS